MVFVNLIIDKFHAFITTKFLYCITDTLNVKHHHKLIVIVRVLTVKTAFALFQTFQVFQYTILLCRTKFMWFHRNVTFHLGNQLHALFFVPTDIKTVCVGVDGIHLFLHRICLYFVDDAYCLEFIDECLCDFQSYHIVDITQRFLQLNPVLNSQ